MPKNVVLRGDWRKMRHKFNRMTELGQHMAEQALYEVAQLVRDELHREANSSPPPMNTSSTEKRKGHNTPLLETGGMQEQDSIVIRKEVVERHGQNYDGFIIGGNPRKFHSRTNKSYEEILGILEHGDDGHLPARPIMSITYDRLEGEIERLAIKEVQDFMR